MRASFGLLGLLWLGAMGCHRNAVTPAQSAASPTSAADSPRDGTYRGFDRNDYPGDDAMRSLRAEPAAFSFTGYWITPPPGETANSWAGKRELLKSRGWGFLVLANGRLDAEILKAQRAGTTPAALGRKDAAAAASGAQQEGFSQGTILFLDQEEGGRLLDEQAAYLLAWTEAVAGTGFRPGVYASGQLVSDGPGVKIDTIEDVRARVKAGNLHPVAIFDALDQCPPAPGCTVNAKPLSAALDPGIDVWQYAQSPRRPEITRSCGATYAADGSCYAPGSPGIFLDMNAASSPDPSHGR